MAYVEPTLPTYPGVSKCGSILSFISLLRPASVSLWCCSPCPSLWCPPTWCHCGPATHSCPQSGICPSSQVWRSQGGHGLYQLQAAGLLEKHLSISLRSLVDYYKSTGQDQQFPVDAVSWIVWNWMSRSSNMVWVLFHSLLCSQPWGQASWVS